MNIAEKDDLLFFLFFLLFACSGTLRFCSPAYADMIRNRPSMVTSSHPERASGVRTVSYSSHHEDKEGRILKEFVFFLMNQTSKHHIYIIHDNSFSGIQQIIEGVFASEVDATAMEYDIALRDITSILRISHTSLPECHVFLFCSNNHTITFFEKVRQLYLGSSRLKWIVTSVIDISTSLQEVLTEGTQVVLVLPVSFDSFQVLVPNIHQGNEVRFRKAGVWSHRSRSNLDKGPLFPDLLDVYGNFEGRQVVVATIDNWPFFQLRYLPDGTPQADQGIDYNVIDSISHYLNFTYRVVEPADGRWGGLRPDGTVYGMVGMVARSEAHVAIDEITITDVRESVVDFTQPYFLESTTLVSRAPEERSRSLAVFYPFTYPLWILLVVVTFLMGPLGFLFSLGHNYCIHASVRAENSFHKTAVSGNVKNIQKSIHPSEEPKHNHTPPSYGKSDQFLHKRSIFIVSWYCFNMFRSVVIQGNRLTVHSWPMRLLLFSWFAFCVILYALYAGTLTAYMTKPSFENPIDSLQDLLEANELGFVPAAQAGTSNEYLLKTAESGIFKALWEMTEPSRSFPKSGHEAMEKVLTDDIVYMSANLNSEIRASQKGRHRFHLARNTFFPQGYGIACFPGAPFKTKFNIILGRMNQGGLVNKWVRDEVGKLRSTNDINTEDEKKMSYILKKAAARSLTLDHLQGAFIILTAGGIVSALSFLMETLKLYA